MFTRVMFFIAAAAVCSACCCAPSSASRKKASPELQKERGEEIVELHKEGWIASIKGDELWVTPAFLLVGFEQKQFIANIVFCQVFEVETREKGHLPTSGETLYIIDNRTGKQIGRYSISDGGLKMD